MIQPIFAARGTFCHSGSAPGHYLGLKGHADVLAGGSLRNEVRACDWPNSLINLETSAAVCGARMPRDGPPWLAPSERALLDTWVGAGARRSCSEPPTCSDTVKPTFAGASSAQALDPDTVRVCWNAASDDKTLPSAITYLVYESATSGGQQLSAPASYAVAGATCIELPSPVRRTSSPSSAQALSTGDVKACDPGSGRLLEMIEGCEMPRDTTTACSIAKACLTPNQPRLIRQWLTNGADQSCPWGC